MGKIDRKYNISGMSCSNCANAIEKRLNKQDGVIEAKVNLLTNCLNITYDDSLLNNDDIIANVTALGYGAKPFESENTHNKELKLMIVRLVLSIILLIPLFYLSMGFMLGWNIGLLKDNLIALASIELILSTLILLINYQYIIGGILSIVHFSFNMDTLILLGSGVSYIYSIIIFILMIVNRSDFTMLQHFMFNISFETAGMVPALITIGKTIETYSKSKSTNAIKSLMELSPKNALIFKNNKETLIPISELQIGDVMLVKPGMDIASDGVIIQGSSHINESMLTGESLPVSKTVNDNVYSASQNLDSPILVKVNKIGEDTTLNQIIKSVEKASLSKAHISKIADKISSFFVPIVILIALITFLVWLFISPLPNAINKGIAVLVISCPCALGLATPVAIMVGSGKGAKSGILYKNAEVIENAGKTNIVVFDKTGTLTNGKLSVSDIHSFIDQDELLSIIYGLENQSTHPIAIAINNYAKDHQISPTPFVEVTTISGKGIKARLGKDNYFAGNLALMNDNNINISNDVNITKTIIYVARNKSLIGYILLDDSIKNDAKLLIDKLKNANVVPIIISGDNYSSTKRVADELGIARFYSDTLPNDKANIILSLKKIGHVMMVGDGINDAVALTSADVGLAFNTSLDIALDSADVVLMKNDLLDIYRSIKLSKLIFKNILENLFWAFIYNIIMIPFATGVFSSIGISTPFPWMGSAFMALSSLFVVSNSLRINLYNNNKPFINHRVAILDNLEKENLTINKSSKN